MLSFSEHPASLRYIAERAISFGDSPLRVSADYPIKFALHDAMNSPHGGNYFVSLEVGVVCTEKWANRPITCKETTASLAEEASVITDRSAGHYRSQEMQRRGACIEPESIYKYLGMQLMPPCFIVHIIRLLFDSAPKGTTPLQRGKPSGRGFQNFVHDLRRNANDGIVHEE